MPPLFRLLSAALCALALASAAPATAGAAPAYRAGEVVVRYATAGAASRASITRTRVVEVDSGQSVASAARALRARPGVLSATANYVAHISGYVPPDPGRAATIAGWQAMQWNFLPETGVNAPEAWAHLLAVGHPGGRGYDFVGDDAYPNDDNGHGTHVAGTIAEGTGNGVGVTGLAYGVKLMPVRVLDRSGEGDSARIARGIRWAADHGAKIINLSFEFPSDITRQQIPNILDALRYARRKGSLVVGASGNAAAAAVAYPARSSDVLSVGDYSNEGQDLDLVAPGGGTDAALEGDPGCHPQDPPGLDIFQMTFTNSVRKFGLPDGYIGTSMAAPHASATAALVVASGLLGPNPTPAAIERRLELTARDLGAPGRDEHYGAGLLDAARATDPAIPVT
jgi:serine protease